MVEPEPLHPRLTRGFLEYAQRRGFIVDPARVQHPKDKPKVERGGPYVRERFFNCGDFDGLAHIRAAVVLEVAGLRGHGTTRRKLLVVFQDGERHALLPWDGDPYEIAHWRNARVHPGHHIQCLQALCLPGQPSKPWCSDIAISKNHKPTVLRHRVYWSITVLLTERLTRVDIVVLQYHGLTVLWSAKTTWKAATILGINGWMGGENFSAGRALALRVKSFPEHGSGYKGLRPNPEGQEVS